MSSWLGWREGGLSRGAQGQGNEGVLDCGWVSAEPRAALRPKDGWGALLTQGPRSLIRSPEAPTQPASQPLVHCRKEGPKGLAWGLEHLERPREHPLWPPRVFCTPPTTPYPASGGRGGQGTPLALSQ